MNNQKPNQCVINVTHGQEKEFPVNIEYLCGVYGDYNLCQYGLPGGKCGIHPHPCDFCHNNHCEADGTAQSDARKALLKHLVAEFVK
jgi:hypothetical protein